MKKAETKSNVSFAPLLGRKDEITSLRKLLKQDDVRMLTLTGAAGIGKTRLAAAASEAAASLFARTIFIDLAPLRNAEHVPAAIARAIGLKDNKSSPLTKRLREAIGAARILLVLDNCEHLLKCKPELDSLIESCPNLKILATSRELFRSKWELVFPVGPLPLPKAKDLESLTSLSRVPSIALFTRQIQRGLPNFELSKENALIVAELCARLDGLPLAIQLAAGQAETQGLAYTLTSLGKDLTSDKSVSVRHGTLRAALDWSCSLLSREEKALFRRLSVFQSDWSIQEAAGVCAGGYLLRENIPALLNRLADLSLVQVNRQARRGKYYRFLETVRSYARMKLSDSGEENDTRRKHRDWFLVWVEQSELEIWGQEAPDFLEQLEMNYNDLWTAMEWCRDTPEEAPDGLRIWASSVGYYDLRGRVAEGISMAKQLLSRSSERTPARARTLLQRGVLLRSQGELDSARADVTECLSFASDLGDTFDAVAALCTLGSLLQIQGMTQEAEKVLKKASVQARNSFESEPRVLYISLFWMGTFYCFQGLYARAVKILKQSLQAARGQGCALFETRILAVLGRALIGTGDYKNAESVLTEGIHAASKLKYYEIVALCLDYLGQAAWAKKQRTRAVRFLAAATLSRRRVGVVHWFPDRDYSRLYSEISAEELEKAAPPGCLLPEQATAWALEILDADARIAPDHESDKLTPREREICDLVTRGLSNREIAETLRISRRTVDAHIRHILVKLDFNTRARISAWYALHQGTSK